jgi:hypothetical protein
VAPGYGVSVDNSHTNPPAEEAPVSTDIYTTAVAACGLCEGEGRIAGHECPSCDLEGQVSLGLSHDRAVVMAAMAHGAAARLPIRAWMRVYLQGDGFGRLANIAAADERSWDWSHVRDSTPEGFRAMRERVELERRSGADK